MLLSLGLISITPTLADVTAQEATIMGACCLIYPSTKWAGWAETALAEWKARSHRILHDSHARIASFIDWAIFCRLVFSDSAHSIIVGNRG